MHCPFCSHEDTRVVDSRVSSDGVQIRRRRACEQCASRFSTLETAMLRAPNIVKSDGRREPFSEDKLRAGMLRALEKRPVNTRKVEQAIRELLVMIRSVDEAEIPSTLIGEWVMRQLRELDQVAYVRFASVYRRFEDVSAFREAVDNLEREGSSDDSRQISLLSKSRASD